MDKIDACLPLVYADLDRFSLLDRSLRENFLPLNICWIIVPDKELALFRKSIPTDIYHLLPESELIPELALFRGLLKVKFSKAAHLVRKILLLKPPIYTFKGWYVQQIIKLAIAQHIQTTFYLTLDADVICHRKVSYGKLIINDRAIVNTEPFDAHIEWYQYAESILGNKRSGKNFGVTPSLLNKQAVLDLQDNLEEKTHSFLKITSRFLPKNFRLTRLLNSWTAFLLRNIPWTEYTLYHTFLEGNNTWDQYHFDGGSSAVYDVYESLWESKYAQQWTAVPDDYHPAPFIVIQSNTGITAQEVSRRLDYH